MKSIASPFPPATVANTSWKLASALFLSVVFVEHSRIFDMLAHGVKIPLLLLALLFAVSLGSGRILVFLRTTAGKIMPAFLVWVTLAYFLNSRDDQGLVAMKSLLLGGAMFALAAGLFVTAGEFRKLFAALGGSAVVLAMMGIVWGSMRSGRFALRDGIYADANYYAMWLLAATPLLWTIAGDKRLGVKLLFYFASALPILMAARTASRGGLLAFALMVAVLFFLASNTTRIAIATLAVLAIVAVASFAPPAIRSRLLPSFAAPGASDEQQNRDNASALARETLLVGSIGLTLDNPVFGVGPGNFPQALADIGRTQGQNWLPLNTHNAYTQISSETGLPGFVLFLALATFSVVSVVSVLRQTRPLGSTPQPEIYELARGLLLSLSFLLAAIFFLSEAYNFLVYLWFGMASGLRLLIAKPPQQLGEMVGDPEVEAA